MNTDQNQQHADSNDEIDLLALIGTLIDYRWLIISITAAFAIAGIIYAVLATPIYQASGLIQIEEKKGGVAGLEGMNEMFSTQSQAVTEIEILKSRMVIGRAVENLRLDIQAKPRHFPVIGETLARRFSQKNPGQTAAPRFGLEQYNWGGAEISIFQLDVPHHLLGEDMILTAGKDGSFTLRYHQQTLLQGKTGEPAESNGISLQIETLDATPGVEFIVRKRNRLQVIQGYQGLLQANERGRQSGMIGITLQHPDPAFARQLLNEIAHHYVRQNIERTSAEAAQSLEFLRQQLPQVRKEMESAENRLNEYQMSANSVNITLETQSVLSQIVELETSLSNLRLRQVELDKRYTREHPEYQTLLNQIQSLDNEKQKLEDRVQHLPKTQQELLRLKRDVEVNSEIYTQLLQKSQELDIARASTVGNVRIIDRAEVIGGPVAPKRNLIVIIATLLGGMVSVGITLVHSLLNRGVEAPSEIEALDLPVYATIPFSDLQLDAKKSNERNEKSLPLLAKIYPAEPSIESLRSLHTSLHFAMLEAANNIIMISGPSPKVGKSFVSVNLATVMAEAGKKILLIDADMRKGYLHKFFDNDNEKGLSSLLAMQTTVQETLIHTGVENLDVITRGHVPPNPSDLLLTVHFNELLDELQEQYDLVIIDTPPILAVADALTVAKRAATNFIVVRFGQNPVNEVRATIKRFENNGITLSGAILNATRKKAMNYYKYGYDSYQYSYSDDLTVKK